jgi:hypothetical protein
VLNATFAGGPGASPLTLFRGAILTNKYPVQTPEGPFLFSFWLSPDCLKTHGISRSSLALLWSLKASRSLSRCLAFYAYLTSTLSVVDSTIRAFHWVIRRIFGSLIDASLQLTTPIAVALTRSNTRKYG